MDVTQSAKDFVALFMVGHLRRTNERWCQWNFHKSKRARKRKSQAGTGEKESETTLLWLTKEQHCRIFSALNEIELEASFNNNIDFIHHAQPTLNRPFLTHKTIFQWVSPTSV